MSDYDLVITGGTVVTPADMFRSDIGIVDGRIHAVGLGLKGTAESTKPDLFAAVQEQLGLKLEAARTPIATVVIDRVERPSDN